MSIYSLKFYVYAYIRLDGTPYYIGKGCGRRAWSHRHSETCRTPKDKSRVIILESKLSNVGALALERRMIRWYGKRVDGTGILRNKTDGGEGTIGSSPSEFARETARVLHSKLWRIKSPSGETYVVSNLPEFCHENKLSVHVMRKCASGNVKQYKGWQCRLYDDKTEFISDFKRNHQASKRSVTVRNSEGTEYTIDDVKQFCELHGLSRSAMSLVINSKRLHHKGWSLIS